MASVAFELPFPPSVNAYWRRNKWGGMTIGKEGHAYRANVSAAVGIVQRMKGRLRVSIVAFPPDKRRRDLDNMLKASLDGLKHAGVFEDDEQIDQLLIQRGEIRKDGALEVYVDEILLGASHD